MDEEFFTVIEIAEMLKVNPQTVRNSLSARSCRPFASAAAASVPARRTSTHSLRGRRPPGRPVRRETPPASVVGGGLRGIEAPALQRTAGPFASRKLALDWVQQEGLGSTPSDAADWAAVYPVSDEEVK
jgi:hypothetical protein